MNTDPTALVEVARARSLVQTGAARAARIAAGLSLGEVARAADVAGSTIWRWEAGQRRPRGEPARRYLAVVEALLSR